MAEYIEREKLYKNLVLLAKYETGERQQGILGCAETVRIFSSANVAPVVRCMDCKYWHKETLFCDYIAHGEARERVNWYGEDFCSYGERKDGDGNG